jgi:hypothetical protein
MVMEHAGERVTVLLLLPPLPIGCAVQHFCGGCTLSMMFQLEHPSYVFVLDYSGCLADEI